MKRFLFVLSAALVFFAFSTTSVAQTRGIGGHISFLRSKRPLSNTVLDEKGKEMTANMAMTYNLLYQHYVSDTYNKFLEFSVGYGFVGYEKEKMDKNPAKLGSGYMIGASYLYMPFAGFMDAISVYGGPAANAFLYNVSEEKYALYSVGVKGAIEVDLAGVGISLQYSPMLSIPDFRFTTLFGVGLTIYLD